jgi:hypothetical protein
MVRVSLNDMLHFEAPGAPGDGGAPATPVADYADAAVDLCMANLLQTAPLELLKLTRHDIASKPTVVGVGSKRYASVRLPDGYLRFGGAWLAGWRKPVQGLSDKSGYAMQLYDSAMSTSADPKAYEMQRLGVKHLDMFPYCGGLADGLYGSISYVRGYDCGLSDANGTEGYISDALVEALVYTVAMHVLVYFGKDASAHAALRTGAMESAVAAVTPAESVLLSAKATGSGG